LTSRLYVGYSPARWPAYDVRIGCILPLYWRTVSDDPCTVVRGLTRTGGNNEN
jgi:hypothetical protein